MVVGAVFGLNAYYRTYADYGTLQRSAQGQNAAQKQGTATNVRGGSQVSVWTARRAASPETPVQPVTPVRAVDGDGKQPTRIGPVIREGADPAEMAVRMRITPYQAPLTQETGKSQEGNDNPDLKVGAESAQETVEDSKCQTCEKRKYQDRSDDMGVSFQTPTNIAPEQAAAAVRGHENEHVVREQAKAKQEGRRVVSQSVTLHTDICPECGKVYISGGTTRTVTAAEKERQTDQQAQQEQEQKGPSLLS